MCSGEWIVKRSHGHPVNHELLYMFGAASSVDTWFLRQHIAPAKDLQPVSPSVFCEQKPAIAV